MPGPSGNGGHEKGVDYEVPRRPCGKPEAPVQVELRPGHPQSGDPTPAATGSHRRGLATRALHDPLLEDWRSFHLRHRAGEEDGAMVIVGGPEIPVRWRNGECLFPTDGPRWWKRPRREGDEGHQGVLCRQKEQSAARHTKEYIQLHIQHTYLRNKDTAQILYMHWLEMKQPMLDTCVLSCALAFANNAFLAPVTYCTACTPDHLPLADSAEQSKRK